MCYRIFWYWRKFLNSSSAAIVVVVAVAVCGCQAVSGTGKGSGSQLQTSYQQAQSAESSPPRRTLANANAPDRAIYSLGDTGNQHQAVSWAMRQTSTRGAASTRPDYPPAQQNQPHVASPIANRWNAAPMRQTSASLLAQPKVEYQEKKGRWARLTRKSSAKPTREAKQTTPDSGMDFIHRQNFAREFQRAHQLEKQRQLNQAIQIYESLVQSGGQSPALWHRLGVSYDKLGRTDLSLPCYQRAMALQPNNVELLCDYGYRWYLLDNDREAEHYYRRALKLSPSHPRANNNLAMLMAQYNRTDDARQLCRNAGLTRQQANHNVSVAVQVAQKPASPGHASR